MRRVRTFQVNVAQIRSNMKKIASFHLSVRAQSLQLSEPRFTGACANPTPHLDTFSSSHLSPVCISGSAVSHIIKSTNFSEHSFLWKLLLSGKKSLRCQDSEVDAVYSSSEKWFMVLACYSHKEWQEQLCEGEHEREVAFFFSPQQNTQHESLCGDAVRAGLLVFGEWQTQASLIWW